MKKTSSRGTTESFPKRSASRPARPTTHPVTKVASETRLGLPTSTALAVLEPAAPAGVPPTRPVRFGYFQPEAHDVHLVGSFNEWDPRSTPMKRDSLGDWSVEIELPPGSHRYRLVVDGEWRDDPAAQETVQNPFGGFDAVMVVV